MFATIIQIKEIWLQSKQVQATKGTLLIVMIYFRDGGNFMWNKGVSQQSVAFNFKKCDEERYFVNVIVWISLSITIPRSTLINVHYA